MPPLTYFEEGQLVMKLLQDSIVQFLGYVAKLKAQNKSPHNVRVVVPVSLVVRILGEMSDHSFPACTFFFFFFKVEISSHTLIPVFLPGSVCSDSASCARTYQANISCNL